MATTIPIPLTTLPIGPTHIPSSGGAAIADNLTSAVVTIDRTVAGGLDSRLASTQLGLRVWISHDAGVTWEETAAATWPGGVYVSRGVQATAITLTAQLGTGAGRSVKAIATVSGQAIAVAGSLVVS